MNHHHRIQGLIVTGSKHVVRRTFAAAAAADKAKKGGGGDAHKGSSLSKEIKSTTVVGAKDGTGSGFFSITDLRLVSSGGRTSRLFPMMISNVLSSSTPEPKLTRTIQSKAKN